MSGDAIVVGAGIGGLAVSRALRTEGWQVEIFERAEGASQEGTALGMWPKAMVALDSLGVGDRVREQGVAQHGATFLRPDGTTFARVTSPEPAYLVSRPTLHQVLHDDALEGSVVWDAPVRDASMLPDADLIVGADGIHSRVRDVVTSQGVNPRPLGTVAFRGVVPGTVSATTETWGQGRLFGITPQDRRTINWFACVRDDVLAGNGGRTDAELLSELFGDWHPAVVDVLSKLEDAQIDRRALYDVVPRWPLASGNAVVIGDAAHAMAPNAGRGACEALVDAADLADALRSAASVPEGLQEFDRRRRRPARNVVRTSWLLNQLSTATRFTRRRHQVMSTLARFA